MLFGNQLAKLHPKVYGGEAKTEPRVIVLELTRNVILAMVISYLTSQLQISTLTDSILLALVLWIGFPGILLFGSVIHEKVPPKLAAIHAGDWLVKLLIMVLLFGLWG